MTAMTIFSNLRNEITTMKIRGNNIFVYETFTNFNFKTTGLV